MLGSPLIATKLGFPRLAGDLVPRPRLLTQLEHGLEAGHSLFLVSAPAGSGKSSLLATWLSEQRGRVAWLSLDPSDNDPVRFMRYLVASLQRLDQPVGSSIEPTLASAEPATVELLMSQLLQEMVDLDDEVFLVLDDYHLISSPEIKKAIAFLLEHVPANVRLLITTRADPQLPLARLRARGLLTEIRSHHLRFTVEEATEYLNVLEGLDLQEDEVRRLAGRTEGWVVGVRLAALALKGVPSGQQSREARSRMVTQFSGRHHFILDYLVEEVLANLSQSERAFLLHTAVLDRFNVGLAEALSPVGGWGESAPVLAALVGENVFLVPLDEERVWYRYHHLFADLLRARLRTERPGCELEVHLRAARWFESEGSPDEAIHQALAGADWEAASDLLGRHAHTFLERGEMLTVMGWIDRLPREVVRNRPQIAIQLAWALSFGNRLSEAEQFVSLAEEGAAVESLALSAEERACLRANTTILRGYYALVAGTPAETIVLLSHIEERLPPTHLKERCVADWLRGYAYRSLGEMDLALKYARRSVEAANVAGPLWHMLALNDLAITHYVRAELEAAMEQYRRALALGESQGRSTHGYLGRVQTGLAFVHLARNELEEATGHARLAVEWTRRWTSGNHLVQALAVLARVQVALGELDEARLSLEEGDRQKQGARLLPVVPAQLETAWVDYWLAAKDFQQAESWADNMLDERGGELLAAPKLSDADLMRLLALTRVRLAAASQPGKGAAAFPEVSGWLQRLEKLVSQAGWKHHLVQIAALDAVAARQEAHGDYLGLVEHALRLGRPGRYVRAFLDLGAEMELLLEELHDAARDVEPAFLGAVLAAFSARRRPLAGAGIVRDTGSGLILEPLTRREAEVLQLLDQGLSNRELARRLFVSEGTVKTHTHRLYRKLGVRSRTGALARARELRLL